MEYKAVNLNNRIYGSMKLSKKSKSNTLLYYQSDSILHTITATSNNLIEFHIPETYKGIIHTLYIFDNPNLKELIIPKNKNIVQVVCDTDLKIINKENIKFIRYKY